MEKKDDVPPLMMSSGQRKNQHPGGKNVAGRVFTGKARGGAPIVKSAKTCLILGLGEAQRLLPKPAEGPGAWSRWQMRLDQPQIAADWMAQALDVPVRKADRGGSVHLPLAPKVVQSQGRTYDTTDTWEEEGRINGVLGFGRKPRWAQQARGHLRHPQGAGGRLSPAHGRSAPSTRRQTAKLM